MQLRDDLCGGEDILPRLYSRECVCVCVCVVGGPIDWVDWIKREEVGLYRSHSRGSDLELGVCSAVEQRNSMLLT